MKGKRCVPEPIVLSARYQTGDRLCQTAGSNGLRYEMSSRLWDTVWLPTDIEMTSVGITGIRWFCVELADGKNWEGSKRWQRPRAWWEGKPLITDRCPHLSHRVSAASPGELSSDIYGNKKMMRGEETSQKQTGIWQQRGGSTAGQGGRKTSDNRSASSNAPSSRNLWFVTLAAYWSRWVFSGELWA